MLRVACYNLVLELVFLKPETTGLNIEPNNNYCCVPHCNSWVKKDSEVKISFHRFPKEMLDRFM